MKNSLHSNFPYAQTYAEWMGSSQGISGKLFSTHGIFQMGLILICIYITVFYPSTGRLRTKIRRACDTQHNPGVSVNTMRHRKRYLIKLGVVHYTTKRVRRFKGHGDLQSSAALSERASVFFNVTILVNGAKEMAWVNTY